MGKKAGRSQPAQTAGKTGGGQPMPQMGGMNNPRIQQVLAQQQAQQQGSKAGQTPQPGSKAGRTPHPQMGGQQQIQGGPSQGMAPYKRR